MVVKGIDVSSHSDKLDIKKLRDNNIEFVMIRAGFTDYNKNKSKNIDKNFYANYELFRKNKFKIGTYYTFLATNKEEAKEELDYFLNIIKDKVFEYPITIQIEDDHSTIIYYPENQKTINNEFLISIVDYIYEKLDNMGYTILIRTYEDWHNSIFNKNTKYNFWVDNVKNYENEYLFYSKEDDIIYLDKDKTKDYSRDDINITLNENCFLSVVGNYIKAGYKILKSKIRKK